MKKIHWGVVLAGVAVGLAALILTAMGNPANMGFCIACFLRDTAGACGLHSAAKVQYVRPEIIGLVLGAFLMSVAGKEFKARAGSSPALRFVIGAFVVIGALAFLGCPLRMVLRLGGGDLNALVGLIPVGDEHSHQRAEVQQHVVKLRDLRGPLHIQQMLGNGQMTRGRDGQKFGDALHQSHDDGGKPGHSIHAPLHKNTDTV